MPQSETGKRIIATPAFLYATVLVGGAIGACARFGLILLFPDQTFPQSTLIINLFGCYAIYLIYQWLGRRVHMPYAFVRGMGIGLVGTFTTLAAFDIECLRMLQNGQCMLFAVYLTVTLACSFLASVAGWGTYNLLLRNQMRRLRGRQHELHERLREEQTGKDGEADRAAAPPSRVSQSEMEAGEALGQEGRSPDRGACTTSSLDGARRGAAGSSPGEGARPPMESDARDQRPFPAEHPAQAGGGGE